MKLEIFDVAVVVLAQDHNPTILHPSFLVSEGIVGKDWELAEPPICTPPFSIAKYTNGITFTVESNKFQVLQAPPPGNIPDSEVPTLASKHINNLEHVRYTTVGINFGSIIHEDEPGKYLIENFLKNGPWNEGKTTLKTITMKFVYPVQGGVLNLSCDPGSLKKGPGTKEIRGIIVKANYHIDLGTDDVLKKATEAISSFAEKYNHFKDTVKKIFNTEE